MEVKDFAKAYDLAVYIRDSMDSYAGQELPLDFRKGFMEYCNHPQYRKKIFIGTDFKPGFAAVLRERRLELLRKILQEEKFV